MLRSLFFTNDNNNSTVINNKTLHWQTTIQRIFFLFEDSKQFVVSININNDRKHLFFQKPIIFGCRWGLFVCFCELYVSFFLICCNILYLKVEILLCQLTWIITAICDFCLCPTLKKRVFFCVRCYIIKYIKIVKPCETTFILFYLFFMRLLRERRLYACVLSLNLCNLFPIYAVIITKKFSFPPFFYFWLRRWMTSLSFLLSLVLCFSVLFCELKS